MALTLASSVIFQGNEGQFHIFSYITTRGHSLIDRELYLPADWCEDLDRRQTTGIPGAVGFQTKPELAVQMMQRIFQHQLLISWVVADTVYGGNLDLRNWLDAHGYHYVLAVACDEPIGIQTPDRQRRRVEVREVEALLLSAHDWQRISMSEGTKGPRLFDWAVVPMLHRWQNDGCHFSIMLIEVYPISCPVGCLFIGTTSTFTPSRRVTIWSK